MTKTKMAYLASTGLLSLMMLASAVMYFVKYQHISAEFINLGYPVYIIKPLAVAKVLGVIALWVKQVGSLRYLAYAGFFYDFVLALVAHVMVADGEYLPASVALILLIVSFKTHESHCKS